MSSSKKHTDLRCYISYGLGEGRVHGRKLKRTLRSHGFSFTQDISKADVIIAHSAGTLVLPQNLNASIVVLVGAPLKHGQPSRSLIQAVWHDMRHFIAIGKFHAWLSNSFWNVCHFFVHPLKALHIVAIMHRAERELPRPAHGQVVFVANHYDPWPDWRQIPHLHDSYAFIGLPGSHNDLWEHPERYVKLIKAFESH